MDNKKPYKAAVTTAAGLGVSAVCPPIGGIITGAGIASFDDSEKSLYQKFKHYGTNVLTTTVVITALSAIGKLGAYMNMDSFVNQTPTNEERVVQGDQLTPHWTEIGLKGIVFELDRFNQTPSYAIINPEGETDYSSIEAIDGRTPSEFLNEKIAELVEEKNKLESQIDYLETGNVGMQKIFHPNLQ